MGEWVKLAGQFLQPSSFVLRSLALTAICAMLPDRIRQFVRIQTLFVRGKLFDQAHRDLVCRRTRLISVLLALSVGTGWSAGAVLSAGTAESIGIALRAGTPQTSCATPAPLAAAASHPGMMFPQRFQRLGQFSLRKFAVRIRIEFLHQLFRKFLRACRLMHSSPATPGAALFGSLSGGRRAARGLRMSAQRKPGERQRDRQDKSFHNGVILFGFCSAMGKV